MEIELWWLLVLPAFFALGWIAARIDIKHLLKESRALPRSYFKGLNFLLNEQPDQAIEAFIEAARVDPETIELHFALGSLFRRRGETDRAIRVHQNLIERDGLSANQRLHALSELGQDYLKAGLLDRAEEIFLKLRSTERDEEALKNLLEIYQQEKDWAKAIAIAEAMPNHSDHLWQKEIAEFRCEMAANEMLHDRHDEARRLLEEALAANRKCVRATLLLGELALKIGAGETAIDHWKSIEQQNPVYLSLAAEKLMTVHVQLGRTEQGVQLLRGWLERHPRSTCSTRCSVRSSTMQEQRRPMRWCAKNCAAIRPCWDWTSCSRHRSWWSRRNARRSGTDQEPDPQPHPPCRALPLRRLRFQGPPVLLALPRLRRLGDLPAAAHRRIRHYPLGNP
jgi:lipopolysaccharide biosynthesis regulator YciM